MEENVQLGKHMMKLKHGVKANLGKMTMGVRENKYKKKSKHLRVSPSSAFVIHSTDCSKNKTNKPDISMFCFFAYLVNRIAIRVLLRSGRR